MTEYNWDKMPVELRTKLLELAGMNTSQVTLKWSGFLADQKAKLNEALYGKTDGMAVIAEADVR
ncbi:MAG: hypothetical protein KAT58_12140 [candidate division Zixibacteria bacterium]|nr:hypothetical protein [candidate division Zixibacteria bacterium]